MEILTSAQMKKVDEETIERFCPGLELMERAGTKVAAFIKEKFGGSDPRVSVFVGPGNNGGDALVVARIIAGEGWRCSVHLLKEPDAFTMDSLKNYQRLSRLAKKKKELREFHVARPDWPREAEKDLAGSELIVDGLFGTGVSGPLRGKAGEVVALINASGLPVVSIDIPSGVNGDTGEVAGEAVQATYTVTIGRPKLGLLFHPGREHAGAIEVADIGFPTEVVEKHAGEVFLLDGAEAASRLPARPPQAHKYSCGTLLFIGGSRAYTGAVALGAEAGLRSGCGMVYLAVPEGVRQLVEGAVPEAVTVPLPETQAGTVAPAASEVLAPYMERADAVALGPGLDRNEETDDFCREFVAACTRPMVLDADGLTAFSGHGELLSRRDAPLVITPHSGELGRILSRQVPSAPSERIELARQSASLLRAVLLHKGAPTIVASPEGYVYVSLHGTSALATAGSGDVLTGLVGGMLAQGASAIDAALVSCYLHARSGELAAEDLGVRGVIAGDLLSYCGPVMVELEAAPSRGGLV